MQKYSTGIVHYHASRFRFKTSYLASVVLIFIGLFVYYQQYPWYSYTSLTILAAANIVINEVKIRSDKITLKEDSFTIELGLLSKKTRKVGYRNVSEIDVRQTVFQRMFGHGDIEIGVLGSNIQHNISHHFSGKGDVKLEAPTNAPHGIILRKFQRVKDIEATILSRMKTQVQYHPHSRG